MEFYLESARLMGETAASAFKGSQIEALLKPRDIELVQVFLIA